MAGKPNDVFSTEEEWPPKQIALVPCSGIQILEFRIVAPDKGHYRSRVRKGEWDERLDRTVETVYRPEAASESSNGQVTKAKKLDDIEAEIASGKRGKVEVMGFTIDVASAIDAFTGQWIPVPVLRKAKGQAQPYPRNSQAYGPINWARMFIARNDQEDQATAHPKATCGGFTHTVCLALDTRICDDGDVDGKRQALRREDVKDVEFCFDAGGTAFCFDNHPPDGGGTDTRVVNNQQWVHDWVVDCFRSYAENGRVDTPEDWWFWAQSLAYYEVCLQVVKEKAQIPVFQIMNTLDLDSPDYGVMNVDLVLDIGNSSTFGILFEEHVRSHELEKKDELPVAHRLEVRDLGQPMAKYSGPFESHVELVAHTFGKSKFADRLPGRPSFIWPSLLRFGKEALGLVGAADRTERDSGLTSPKRYLWDTEQPEERWRLHNEQESDEPEEFSVPTEVRKVLMAYNQRGDVISQVKEEKPNQKEKSAPEEDQWSSSSSDNQSNDPRPVYNYDGSESDLAMEPCFSRSALFGCMIQEILAHALVQINDPQRRAEIDKGKYPRRLRRLILTVPTAITMRERMIVKSRAEGALRALQDIQGYGKTTTWDPKKLPEVIVKWDEASCSQLVYLYSEINERFRNSSTGYLELRGQTGNGIGPGAGKPSIRIACIDIGGGTTDLAITSYSMPDDSGGHLTPRHEFREGFRRAGDNVVHGVIENIIIPELQKHAFCCIACEEEKDSSGSSDGTDERIGESIKDALSDFFDKDAQAEGQTSRALRTQMRRVFTLQVLVPLAVELLSQAEQADKNSNMRISLGRIHPSIGNADGNMIRRAARYAEDCVNDRVSQHSQGIAIDRNLGKWDLLDFHFEVNRRVVDKEVTDVLGGVLRDFARVIGRLECNVILLSGRPSRLPAVQVLIEKELLVRPDNIIPLHKYRAGWYPVRSKRGTDKQIGDPKTTVAVGAMLMQRAHDRDDRIFVWTRDYQVQSSVKYIGRIPDRSVNRLELFDGVEDKDGEFESEFNGPMDVGYRQLDLDKWPPTHLYLMEYASAKSKAKEYRKVDVVLKRTQPKAEDVSSSDPAEMESGIRRLAAYEELALQSATVPSADQSVDDIKDEFRLRFFPINPDDKAILLDMGEFEVKSVRSGEGSPTSVVPPDSSISDKES